MMMARRAVPPSLWSGTERLRVRERLQASLAGILELELLRDRQSATVERALEERSSPKDGGDDGRRQPQDNQSRLSDADLPLATKLDRSKSEDLLETPKKPHVSYCSSENIEAGSGILYSGSGDGADKGCLRLQMVSEQLLFPKKSGGDMQEILEADSRPSSGFYETSEMGSLSDSCASVQSDGPGESRCSVGSLSQLPGLQENSFVRPRSTDEAAVRLLDLQLQRLTLMNAPGTDSRRPVSTGDLEFLLGLGDPSLPLSKQPRLQLPQYKLDLVSRNTNEIYHYPSPLHAVALQSPLFTSSLSQSSSQEELDDGPAEPAKLDSPARAPAGSQEKHRAQLDRYIAKLVLRHKCRSAVGRPETGYLAGNQKSMSVPSVCSAMLGPSQLIISAPGWKVRQRISTCSHLRSPEGSEGMRDSQVLDGQGEFDPFLEISSVHSCTTNLSQASEPSVMCLPEPVQPFQDPSLISYSNRPPTGLERGVLDWVGGIHHHFVPVQSPTRKELPSLQATVALDKLYKGKHASRELVKTTERLEKPAERSWLSPRELLRRWSLRCKPSTCARNRTRASSEINVHLASGLVDHSDPHAGKGKAMKPRWASVLEISSKASGRHRPKAGNIHLPPLRNRHLAFSSDSPTLLYSLGDSHLDLPPRQWAGFAGSGSSLREVDATSAISLNGDWILHHLGDRWPHASATLDSADLPVSNFKLRRSRSFKELKRMMSRSRKGAKANK